MNKKYLITGVTGFASAHLAQLLHDKGHEVYAIIRRTSGTESDILDTVTRECFNSIKFLYGDLTDYRSIEKIFSLWSNPAFDGVFHLASQSSPPASFINPLSTFNTNIMGTANLIECIERYTPDTKVMFCSTSEVYGNAGKDGQLLSEETPFAPANPYSISKSASDLSMQERMMNGKIKGFITRAFSHCGPRRGRNFSISADAYQVASIMKGVNGNLKKAIAGEPHTVEVGNLETIRTVVDVRDIVLAYYMLMESEGSTGKIFNVCGEISRKMSFFTDYLIKLSGMKIEKKVSPKYYREIDIHCQIGDCSKLKALTGWEPTIPIEKTLEDLLNYWLKKLS